jgi:acetylornithine/N-succinyldiaminopimelate aminotransferase
MSIYPELDTAEVVAKARSHYTPNYRQAPVVLTRGEGVWVWDRDGKRYLDMIAGIAVCSLGHAHPRLVDAISRQAGALIHTSSLWHNEPAVALMEKLTELSFADSVFFGNSGTEANEAALKLARRYRSVIKKQPERPGILAFHKSFHGRSYMSMTVTGQPKYHKGFEPLVPDVHYADYGDLDSVELALNAAKGRISTIIVEPIQCEGGLRVPPEGFLKGLRNLCDRDDMILIFDEVQTGMGRVAEWFCYEISGVQPDIMTLAKGIASGVPLGAMLATAEVARGFEPGAHASTFGGNPLATRAGLEVVRVIEDDKLLDHAYEMGEFLNSCLEGLIERHGDKCVEARGCGLLRGLELVDDDRHLGKAIVNAAREKGMLLNAIGGHILRFSPPLIIDREQLQWGVTTLSEIMDEL